MAWIGIGFLIAIGFGLAYLTLLSLPVVFELLAAAPWKRLLFRLFLWTTILWAGFLFLLDGAELVREPSTLVLMFLPLGLVLLFGFKIWWVPLSGWLRGIGYALVAYRAALWLSVAWAFDRLVQQWTGPAAVDPILLVFVYALGPLLIILVFGFFRA